MKPLEPHEAGYIQKLIERTFNDPEGVRRELEAKEHLSLAEFNILEILKQCKEVRSCKYCGRPFAPRWKNQKYCSKSCRIVYHSVRYKRKYKEFLRMKHRWKSMRDPSYREKWMSRLNKLRAKEGRLPYWFTGEGRPYTEKEIEYMRQSGKVPVKGGEELLHPYTFKLLGRYDLLREWEKKMRPDVTVVLPRREDADTPSDVSPVPEQPKTFVCIRDSVLGCDMTYKIPVRPNTKCSHEKRVAVWTGLGVLGSKRQALVCQECGAIKFPDEGQGAKWQHFVDADIYATPIYRP